MYNNNHIANAYGSYQNQDGTSMHTRYKMAMCLGDGGSDVQCLLQRTRPGMCPCEHHTFTSRTQNDPRVVEVPKPGGRGSTSIVKCGGISSDHSRYDIPTETVAGADPVYGLPFTLHDLLPLVAKNNHVIVTGEVEFGVVWCGVITRLQDSPPLARCSSAVVRFPSPTL